jgi:hypothetical protein
LDLDSSDALGSTVEPYVSPSYLLDDDDDVESELDPGILQHPGEPSNIAVFFHYYSSYTQDPDPLYFYFSQCILYPNPVRELKPALKWG